MEALCCHHAAACRLQLSCQSRRDRTGGVGGGRRGVANRNLVTEGPFPYSDHSDREAPPTPARRRSESLPVTKALSSQEALAALWLVSHLVDRHVTAQSSCSWREKHWGPSRGEKLQGGGCPRGHVWVPERDSASPSGMTEPRRGPRRNPTGDP